MTLKDLLFDTRSEEKRSIYVFDVLVLNYFFPDLGVCGFGSGGAIFQKSQRFFQRGKIIQIFILRQRGGVFF